MRKNIPVEESFRKWEENPAFVAAYEALEEEFELARASFPIRENDG